MPRPHSQLWLAAQRGESCERILRAKWHPQGAVHGALRVAVVNDHADTVRQLLRECEGPEQRAGALVLAHRYAGVGTVRLVEEVCCNDDFCKAMALAAFHGHLDTVEVMARQHPHLFRKVATRVKYRFWRESGRAQKTVRRLRKELNARTDGATE